ncbi:hypothetical protein B0H19DRAFT_1081496 [Mycena capillaripes]|nr:hypothetical protein B0H19DRAFT_1081496 [Mycena capillaripes]
MAGFDHSHSVNSANVVDEYGRHIYTDDFSSAALLAQANAIFNSLAIRSDLDEYGEFQLPGYLWPVFVECIQCWLRLLGPIDNLPPGYLLLYPFTEIQTKLPTKVRLPECLAYWSLDPSAAEHLSAKGARNTGFLDIEFNMLAHGRSWEDSVFAGVCQFHQAERFDPYSQEVATALGYSLFQVSCEQNTLFAHGNHMSNIPQFMLTVLSGGNRRRR